MLTPGYAEVSPARLRGSSAAGAVESAGATHTSRWLEPARGVRIRAEQPRDAVTDQLAAEAPASPVEEPCGVDLAEAIEDPKRAGMRVCELDERDTRVILAGEQVAGHDRIRRLFHHPLPRCRLDIAERRRHDPKAPGLLRAGAHEQP